MLKQYVLLAAASAALAGCLGGSDSGIADNGLGGGQPTNPSEVDGGSGSGYNVTITRTTYGVPHIKAKDYKSLGYGEGYAFAQDNLCVFLEDLLTIRGERSRYFGADGTYTIEPNGSTANNVDSDFFWKSLFAYQEVDTKGVKRTAWEKTRENTLPDFKDVVTGYTAGVNRYIAELKSGGQVYTKADGSKVTAHAACANAEWLQPIAEADLYRRFVRLSVLASTSVFVGQIGSTQPPSGLPVVGGAVPVPAARSASSASGPAAVQTAKLSPQALKVLKNSKEGQLALAALQNNPNPFTAMQDKDKFGSNMYAFGREGTQNGQSLVYGNPHFPWKGTERLYLSHNILEIDGRKKMDIMGVGLYGVPAVLIGFNEKLAWSHTVSTAFRFTMYQLQINPQNPLQYMKDGKAVDFIALPTEIEVKGTDGKVSKLSRTMYRSEYGPMLKLTVSGVPVLDWNQLYAFTVRDANLENDRLINQFAKWNMAESLEEFIDLHKSVLGVPWVNTVASGPNKPAYYGDVTVVPNVPDSLTAACKMEPFHTVLQQLSPGLPVLDGSKSACAWKDDADAPAKGVFGGSNLPTLLRDDYVTNCNDSHWLTNPRARLSGYARIIGDENAERTLRTRLCILQAERRLAGTDEFGSTKKMSQDLMKTIALNSEIYSATLTKEQVLGTLCQLPAVVGTTSPAPVQTAAACAALRGWDGKDNLESKGAHLWREFWTRAVAPPGFMGTNLPVGVPQLQPPALALPGVGTLPVPAPPASLPSNRWTTAFTAADPVNTPRGLNPANPFIAAAFADAITAVQDSGFALDAPLKDIQFSGQHLNSKIAVFGGSSPAGAFTIARTGRLSKDGYKIDYGNSYIQAVTWVPDNNGGFKPKADAMLTYSNSTDPANPHYDDYTKAYAAKEWLTLPFTPSEIEAQKVGESKVLTAPFK